MKKNGMLNSHIAKVLADLGHTDTIVIADAGLPVPDGVRKIDVALREGTPSFLEVIKLMQEEMVIEQVTLAEEIAGNEAVHQEMAASFPAIRYTAHEAFKEATAHAKAVIRTGETTPYANAILHAGVTF
ncbi:UNVERIFIED_CONTAM: D-ribose pyranase [Halobacillus marinus]